MRYFYLFILLLFTQCAGGTPEYKVARQFIDSYYVMADQNAALNWTEDNAKLKIDQEIELLTGVEGKQSAYKARDIEFQMLKEMPESEETNFLFELSIHIVNAELVKKNVAITVDKNSQKVKFFGEI